MSPTLIGGLIGLFVGFSGFLVLRMLADKIAREGGEVGQRKAAIFRAVAVADLVLMTLFGAYVGPMLAGE